MADRVMQYPKFIVFGLMDYGPHICIFKTAQETAAFLWGKNLSKIAVFKNQELVYLKSAEIGEIEQQLAGEPDAPGPAVH